jgi:hypothetical protein
MRVDPEVCRRMFDAEVEQLRRQSADLRLWGCIVVDTTFPNVDVIFFPCEALQLATVGAKASPLVLLTAEAEVQKVGKYGAIGSLAFGVRFGLDDFDQRPVSVSFRNPRTWEPLSMEQLPVGQRVDENGKKMPVLVDVHPLTRRPFLCMQGIREYHEHPQHGGDDWLLYRTEMRLLYTVHSVWKTCVEAARPTLLMQVQTTNPVSFQMKGKLMWSLE